MRLACCALFVLVLATTASAQRLDVPIIDLPYNTANGGRFPSMEQSLGLTTSFYDLTHYSLQTAWGPDHEVLGKSTVALFDLVTLAGLPLPLTDAWVHEEWHRAVMGNRGIDSFDDVYLFKTGATAINVSHVKDEDLIRLKRDHNPDLVRLDEAGIEAELAMVQRLEKGRFYRGSRSWHLPLYWAAKVSAYAYVHDTLSPSTEEDTNQANRDEGADVKKRDFTGYDFTGWIYELSRPDEPYEARGLHPSGVGINRYRKPSDLTPEERQFVKKQGKLQLVNFLDSNLIGIDSFTTTVAGRPASFNVTGAHYLTSFGYSLDANVFFRSSSDELFVVLHAYANGQRYFPGAEVQLIDRAVKVAGHDLRLTPRLALWMQPEHQRFRDTGARLGGLAGLRVDFPLSAHYGSFAELDAKSAGWVMGNEHLDSNVSMRFGLTGTFGR